MTGDLSMRYRGRPLIKLKLARTVGGVSTSKTPAWAPHGAAHSWTLAVYLGGVAQANNCQAHSAEFRFAALALWMQCQSPISSGNMPKRRCFGSSTPPMKSNSCLSCAHGREQRWWLTPSQSQSGHNTLAVARLAPLGRTAGTLPSPMRGDRSDRSWSVCVCNRARRRAPARASDRFAPLRCFGQKAVLNSDRHTTRMGRNCCRAEARHEGHPRATARPGTQLERMEVGNRAGSTPWCGKSPLRWKREDED